MNRYARWIPAVAVPALVVAGAIAVPAVASAAPTLPEKSPAQVLAMVADAKGVSYSGTLEQSSNLGLPQLPASAASPHAAASDSTAADLLQLLSRTNRIRVYVDGETKQRVQVLDDLAERDVVRNGSTVWTWDSKGRKATKVTLPSKGAATKSDSTVTPASLAAKLIAAVQPATQLSVSSTASIAGRDAYQLTMTPKTAGTLVRDVVLSVDAKTGLPLQVRVDATGQKAAAVTVGFTAIDYGKPDAKLFDFSAPSGAKVTTKDLSQAKRPEGNHGAVPQGADAARPSTVGTGWSTIAVLPAASDDRSRGLQSQKLFGQLTQKVAGGSAVQTSLVSVLFADDGRVLVGAVPVSALQAAAG
ncbi:MAG: DUF2092 domain-containing protein [Micrococcales bacterium]|nr:DUF2092 domain-containing protein [Micrococcales bacterium]